MRKPLILFVAALAFGTISAAAFVWGPTFVGQYRFHDRFLRIGAEDVAVFQSRSDQSTWWLVPPLRRPFGLFPCQQPLGKVLAFVSSQSRCALLLKPSMFELKETAHGYRPFLTREYQKVQVHSGDVESCVSSLEAVGVRLERGLYCDGFPVLVVHAQARSDEDFDLGWTPAEEDF